ncbi:MAG: hypothetical protein GY791_17145 [Alphaproteobacteria bacterium]|nr:hypothetical protein [Alphaproteobacteria bacterium]
MKTKVMAVLLAAVWGFLPAMASSAEDDGVTDAGDFAVVNVQDLVDLCTVPQGHELSDKGAYFCMGYITGVIQYHNARTAGPNEKPVICPDSSASRLDLVEAFVNWARANPKSKDAPAIEGVAAAAIGKWPCP